MRKISFFFFLLISLKGFAQGAYWQQEVNYTIDVKLNDKKQTLGAYLALEYINHSPDSLNYIYFHLWPNGYKNNKTAFAKQVLSEKNGKKLLKEMKARGGLDSLDFKVNGQKVNVEQDGDNIDVVKVFLPAVLTPGNRVTITTPFRVQIPTYISRMGHKDQSYMMCQWYPKPAVYDKKGWHAFPYLDHGEFYGEFGTFNVNITVPSDYVVGASGVLLNNDEFNMYKELGKSNYSGTGNKKYTYPGTSITKTLSYKSDSIHDFAWFADKDFIIEYDTLTLPSGRTIDVFAYHQPNGVKFWEKGTEYIEDAVRKYSNWIGEYPYPIVQAVEGPKNASSGGMEYPMITLITKPDADEEKLDGVITHEVGHNWFYGILGSNERKHAWMDEGMNTYYQFRYEAEKYKSNSVFGSQTIPATVKAQPVDQFQSMLYNALLQIPMEKPIETHSADFTNEQEYGAVVYLKTSIWMYIIESSVTKERFDSAMQEYYRRWKFKHPYPEDFKAVLEDVLKVNMTPLFDILNKKGSLQ